MPESIYIATSPQYEGIVKIGRTDRPVQERMDELSNRNYGLEGEAGDMEWEVANVIVVDDNVAAEAMLHKHFDSIRVSDSRELFYSNDPESLATEAASISDGKLLLEEVDADIAIEVLDTLVQLGLVVGVGAIAGRALHKRFTGHPRYEKFVSQASQRGRNAQHFASAVAKDAEERWTSTAPKRAEIYDAAVSTANNAVNAGRENWDASKPLRTDVAQKARERAEGLKRGIGSVSQWVREKIPKGSGTDSAED